MKNIFFTLTIVLAASTLTAQKEILPKWMTEEEKAAIPAYKVSLLEKEITTPPVGSEIRTPGQWEEVQAVCITWT
ncbi:MAG: hypothetical protein ACK5XN_14955, partial [Bacteroidota bacterium]